MSPSIQLLHSFTQLCSMTFSRQTTVRPASAIPVAVGGTTVMPLGNRPFPALDSRRPHEESVQRLLTATEGGPIETC